MKYTIKDFERVLKLIISQNFPSGIDFTDKGDLCDTLEKITSYYELNRTLLIWTGASKDTIFSNPCYNWLFRAWHDLVHVKGQYPFTKKGEYLVYKEQCKMIDALPIHDSLKVYCKAILDIEINGQIDYMELTGDFVKDQKTFTSKELKRKYSLTL